MVRKTPDDKVQAGAPVSPQTVRLADLPLVAGLRLHPPGVPLHHRRVRDAELPATKSSTSPGTSSGSFRNVPSQRTVTSWSAKPAFIWSPRRRSTSFRSGERWTGVLSRLNDPAYFAKVTVDLEAGTIVWPGGIDLAPEPLYEQAKAHPLLAA